MGGVSVELWGDAEVKRMRIITAELREEAHRREIPGY